MSNPPGSTVIHLIYHNKWHRVAPFVILATVSRLICGSGGQVQNQFGLMLICQWRSEGVLKNLVFRVHLRCGPLSWKISEIGGREFTNTICVGSRLISFSAEDNNPIHLIVKFKQPFSNRTLLPIGGHGSESRATLLQTHAEFYQASSPIS